MKVIIGGKKYDTETATCLGDYENYEHNPSDFHHYYEALYRKTNGEYFLAGEGGPLSKYAECLGGNRRAGGEKVFPLTPEKAKSWAERHMTVKAYETEFGPVDE